ncbi:MAG: hypothetical protein NTX57_17355 [Armatimonadetes bacterium]|nr:hypothetical protein [Armatimonadota bacterium]
MIPYLTMILYIHISGLLSLASARVSAQEIGLVPIAVGEGKVIRDASPQARHSGVHVGQSVLRARRLCPMLLVVPLEQVDPRPLSHCLYDVLAEFSPTVEPVAPDAAYVVLERGEEPLVHRRLAEAFPELSPVLATGSSKLIARTLAESGVAAFDLAPSHFLWPEDAAITGKLERLGLHTTGEVAHTGETALRYQFGHKLGSLLYRRAQGLDGDPVRPLWPLPTIDLTCRFDLEPLEDATCLDVHIVALARQGAGELTQLRRYGRMVALAVETERGKSEHSWRPPWPIQSPAEVVSAARRLLTLQQPRSPVTALRLTIAELELPQAESLSLFDSVGVENQRRLEAAKRFVVARYGSKALTTLGKVPVALRDRRRELVREATKR